MAWIPRLRRPSATPATAVAPTEHETGYVKLMIMFGVPLTDPAQDDAVPPGMIVRGDWERIVTMRPDDYGYPWGTLPRLVLLWLAKQARETQSPVIDLGATPQDFIEALGSPDASTGDILWQAQRLFGASITLGDATVHGRKPMTVRLHVAKDFRFWDGERGQVTLAEHLYQSIAEHPAPIDWEAVKGGRLPAMAIDVYAWLNLRIRYHEITAPERISWNRLSELFAHNLPMDAFRPRFEDAVGHVAPLVPEVAVGITDAGATLSRA
ncbi:hypothetical protein ACFOYW_08555 [Gryllotalpicola reticulitermitis]|uniref:RepA protein n=1 Tax=Gryllotalpicola reticulitermitis TaxID=1184153 RepID=A0ABV8Q5Z1_9MICO